MKTKVNFKRTLLSSSMALPILLGSYALPLSATAEEANKLTLEEVVVTARRRTESLQDIPDSVTVLGAELIENAGIGSLRDVSKLVPNMNLLTGEQSFRAGVIQLVVRGVTTPQTGEAPMSFVIDGVTVPEVDFINQDLVDIESVEVLRGPQGALYGRGALGGAVLINTKQPTDEASGSVKLSYAEGNDRRVTANVSGPITDDKLYYKLTASVRDRDGQIENITVGEDVDFNESTILKGGLKYVASDAVQVDWSFNYLNSDIGGGVFRTIPLTDLNNDFDDIGILQNVLGENSRDIFETSVKVEWDLGFAQLTSVTAYAEIEDEVIGDGDFSERVSGAQRNRNEIDSVTQEFRLASNDDQSLRWILGAFYQDRSREFEFDFANDVGRTSGSWTERFDVNFIQIDNTDSTAYGLFGQINYDVTDKLELTAALRYDDDERDFDSIFTNPAGSFATTFVGSDGTDELQPKFSLSYDVNDNVLAYVTYSHGYRAGGFNEAGFTVGNTHKEENSDSIEVGIKTTLLDGLMTLNAALYSTELENNQISFFDRESFTLGILNLKDAEVSGLDLEIAVRPTEGLDLSFGLGVSDSEINDADGAGLFSGNTIPFVPDYTFNLGAQYTWSLSNADVIARLDYNKIGELHFDRANTARRDATDNLNLRLTWKNDNWSLAAYLDNVTDQRVAIHGSSIRNGNINIAPNAPKAAGVEVSYKF